jgi:hypothetical protein
MTLGKSNTPSMTSKRPPVWRQTKEQKIDNKVARLFENYKLIDEAANIAPARN